MTDAPETASAPAKKSISIEVSPLFLSAVVLPGLGQFVQGRRTAGLCFATAFIFVFLLLVMVLINYLLVFIPIVREALIGNPPDAESVPPVSGLYGPVGVVLAIYLANIIDVLVGARKHATLEAFLAAKAKRPRDPA